MSQNKRRTYDSKIGAVLRLNINRILIEQGLQASDLYTQAAMSSAGYSRMFKVTNGPYLSTLCRLASVLRVDVADIVRGASARV